MVVGAGSFKILCFKIFLGAKEIRINHDEIKIKNQGSGMSCGIH